MKTDSPETETDSPETGDPIYPDCYLYVVENRSGEDWIFPIPGDMVLDIDAIISTWLETEFSGELKLSGETVPSYSGDYYAKIVTDGRPPDSPICWTSGGFYVETTY